MSGAELERFLSMSAFEAAHAVRTFRLRAPDLSDEELVQTARAVRSDLYPHDYTVGLRLEGQIPPDISVPHELFFTAAVDCVIASFRPFWVRLSPGGRAPVLQAMGVNGAQCLRAAGLLETTERAIRWWDHMADAVRKERDAKALVQGRYGERLSFEREQQRLIAENIDRAPQWIALEDNSVGYDILSYVREHGHIVNRLIEVKSTQFDPPRFILTRNEWAAAERFGSSLEFHVWKLPEEAVFTLTVDQVRERIPQDQDGGEWLDAEIIVEG